MNKVLTTIFLSLISISFCLGQTQLDQSIWFSKMVYDTLGTPYPNQNIERFMFFENENNISSLSLNQRTSMSNGETIISYTVKANNLAKVAENSFKVKEYRVDNFTIINADSIYYREKNYHIGFKRLKVERSKQTQDLYLNFLLNNQVRQYYENGENLNQIHSYKSDGSKKIDVVDSESGWDSPYRLLSFEGFVFLRGITSAPMILMDLKKDKIIANQVNRKKKSLKTEIQKE